MRTGTITLSIDSCLDDVFLVGLAVNKICAFVPLDETAAYHAELCVVEAVNNAIEHGYASKPGQTVAVVVSLAPDRITFTVRDNGPPIERAVWERLLAEPVEHDLLAEGGRGLFIIQRLMDELRYEREGTANALTFVKRLKSGAASG